MNSKKIPFYVGFLACLIVLPCCKKADRKVIAIREILSIGSIEDDLFYMLTGLVSDKQGNVFVLDSMDCSIKKMDRSGRLLKKTGRRGQGPIEFVSPQIIKCHEKNLYVYDLGLSCIHVFDTDLNYLYRSQLGVPITEMEVLSSEQLLIHSFVLTNPLKIAQLNLKENLNSQVVSYKEMENSLVNVIKLEVDEEGDIYICHLFEDKIEKYDKNMRQIWSQSLMGGIEAKTESHKNLLGKIELPSGMIYKEIELDQLGHLFVWLIGHSYG